MVGLQQYLSDIYADDAGKALFDTLLAQQKQNTGNKANEFLANGKTYYATLASAPGTVRLGLPFNLSYTFAENGLFTQQSLDEIPLRVGQLMGVALSLIPHLGQPKFGLIG